MKTVVSALQAAEHAVLAHTWVRRAVWAGVIVVLAYRLGYL